MVVVVMGVSGSGKSTIGEKLAAALHCPFLEGDELHPQANVDKMRGGQPLDDADRAPWLDAIAARIRESIAHHRDLVVACSALKQSYRDRLRLGPAVKLVLLTAPPEVLKQRVAERKGHFMPASLLPSQLATLEPPGEDEIVVSTEAAPDDVVTEIRRRISS